MRGEPPSAPLHALPGTRLAVALYAIDGQHLCVAIHRDGTCLGRLIFEDLCVLEAPSILIGEHRLRPEPRR